MAYGGDWHWRNTMRPVRLGSLDARSAFGICLVLLHARLWTIILMILIMIIFGLVERMGLTFESALRALRLQLAGPRRPAIVSTARRRMVDYGK